MGALLVVDLAEAVQLCLELAEGRRRRLRIEPLLECLVESLNLPLGLGVTRMSVLVGDVEGGEHVLEGVAPTQQSGRVDDIIISQSRGGHAVVVDAFAEDLDDDRAGDARMSSR